MKSSISWKKGFLLCLLIFLNLPIPAQATPIKIAYVGFKEGLDLGFLGPEGGLDLKSFGLGRGTISALAGVRMAFREAQRFGQYKKIQFELVEKIGADEQAVLNYVKELIHTQIPYLLLDVPAATLKKISNLTRKQKMLLLNIAAIDDDLRGEFCAPHLFHVIPSRSMLADGLAQYLLKRKWRKWLLITGPRERDLAFSKAMLRSAKRYGASIVDNRIWKDNADLRRTAGAEFPLFTAKAEYDVVVVADEEAEFGEMLPFNTYLPRPVVGTQGLSPHAWFWAFSQWGATQLNKRFVKATGRKMNDTDWSGWLAMTIVSTAIIKGGSADFADVQKYMLNPKNSFHGYKGRSLSFRSWNHQLRQAILLTTAHAQVSHSPQDGYLHPVNKLDTLGYDKPESRCEM